jgi:hypothetical protein
MLLVPDSLTEAFAMTRIKTCFNCPNWGDHHEAKVLDEKEYRPCHGKLPELAGDPRGIGRFPLMPSGGWCAHHGVIGAKAENSTPTHYTADEVKVGPVEDQPKE